LIESGSLSADAAVELVQSLRNVLLRLPALLKLAGRPHRKKTWDNLDCPE
jgi:hypothetical protein